MNKVRLVTQDQPVKTVCRVISESRAGRDAVIGKVLQAEMEGREVGVGQVSVVQRVHLVNQGS